MMGLTACSEKQANVENPMLTEADALGLGENVVETINLYVQQNAKDQITDAVLLSAVESWESAAEDMGDYIGIISTDSDITEDDGIIRVTVEGSTRNAVVELVLYRIAGAPPMWSIPSEKKWGRPLSTLCLAWVPFSSF